MDIHQYINYIIMELLLINNNSIIWNKYFHNLENSAMATGLEKVSFHFNPKERQCQRVFKLPYSCTHLTY